MPALDDWKLTSFFEISVGSCGFHQLQKRPKQGHKVAQMAITCVFNLKCSDFFATKSATNIRWTYIRYQTALSTDICSHSLSHLAGMFGIFANGNSLATRIPGRCQEHRFNIFNFKIKRKQRKGRQLSQYSTHLWQKNHLEIFFLGGKLCHLEKNIVLPHPSGENVLKMCADLDLANDDIPEMQPGVAMALLLFFVVRHILGGPCKIMPDIKLLMASCWNYSQPSCKLRWLAANLSLFYSVHLLSWNFFLTQLDGFRCS